MIYLGADHRGFELKKKISEWLGEWKFEYEDLGAMSLDPKDDYTIFAESVAQKIKEEPLSFGILICGSGVGVDVTANKFDGVRASIGKSANQIRAGRTDDNMNVLVIGADFTNEKEAADMLQAFLETKFDEAPRHEKRLEEISKIEENN